MTRRMLTVLLMALASVAQAGAIHQIRLTPGEIAAKEAGGAGADTSGVAGIQTTVLLGDPTQPGLYTIRLSIPANTKIQAHTHRDDRSAIVMSGTWYFGMAASPTKRPRSPCRRAVSTPSPAGWRTSHSRRRSPWWSTSRDLGRRTQSMNAANDPRRN